MEKLIELNKSLSSRFLSDVALGQYNQFGTGGRAKFLFIAENIEDLICAVAYAQKSHLPYCVIGTGGGLLFSDDGFDGLVVVNRSPRIDVIAGENVIVCDSGISLNHLIGFSAGKGLSGLEALAGINGSVGGAIFNNARVGVTSLGSCLRFVTMLTHKGKIVRKDSDWLELSLRTSKLCDFHKLTPWTILSATFQFYRRRFEDVQKDINAARSAGTNLEENGVIAQAMASPDPEHSAPELISSAGTGSAREGGAEIMRRGSDSLRNSGSATSADARRLIEKVVGEVAEKEGIKLQETISYLGSWR